MTAPLDAQTLAAAQAAAQSTTLNPRLAPQSLDAERSVLGGVLLTNDALFDALELVRPEDFYREAHRKVFAAMVELTHRGAPIDLITLRDELQRKGQLDDVGGDAYLATLDAAVPATANLARYAKIVRDKAIARRLIEAAHHIAREGYEQRGDVQSFLDSAEQQLFDVIDGGVTQGGFRQIGGDIRAAFATIEAKYERQEDVTGLATGLDKLDRLTTGFQKGDFILIGGRPSMGKTGVVMNMAAHVAVELKRPVGVVSLEMSAEQLVNRLFGADARVDGHRLRSGKLVDHDWPKLARSAERLYRAPLYIDDRANVSVFDVRAAARRLKAKHPELALLVVDYLQLMKGTASEGREQEISEISRGLKLLAKELDLPVIALSQLNRSLEKREDKRPVLADLRESGSLEQDADLVIFVYRDEVYDKGSRAKGTAELIVRKQRNGAIGTVRVAFLKEYTRFDNLASERPDLDGDEEVF